MRSTHQPTNAWKEMKRKPTYPTISESRLIIACEHVDRLNDEIIRLGLSRLVNADLDDESGNIPRIYVKDNLDYMEDSTVYIKPLRTMKALRKLPVGTTEAEFWDAIVRA